MKHRFVVPLLFIITIAIATVCIAPQFALGLPLALVAGTVLGDLNGQTQNVTLLPAQQATSTVTQATAVDLSSFIGQLKIILDAGAASAGTSPTLNVTIEDSADGTNDFQTVATFAEVSDAASLQSIGLETRNVRKYIRAKATIAGTDTPTFIFAVHAVGQKQYS